MKMLCTQVKVIEQIGNEQYNTFVAERIDTRKFYILTKPIKQKKFPLISRQNIREVSKGKMET